MADNEGNSPTEEKAVEQPTYNVDSIEIAKEPAFGNVVFEQNKSETKAKSSSPPTAEIPEEYLTDEDLYPETTEEGTSPTTQIKKKLPIILVGIGGFFVLLLLIVVLAKLFGRPDGASNEAITLKYWGLWQKESVINEVIKDYQKQNPNITIEYTLMDAKDNYRERVIERTRNNIGPDIFRYHNTWVPMVKELLASAPSTVFTEDEFQAWYYPVMVKDLVIDGQIIGLPYNLDGLVLLYNDQILKSAGVSSPPGDWEELINVANKATVRDESGNVITAGIALGAVENISHFSDILGLMFLQNGADITKISNDLNAQTVLDTYTQFVLSVDNVWSDGLDNSVQMFVNEQTAMIFAPVWQIEVIKHLNPDLTFKVAQVPQIRGGQKKSIANYWVDGVSKGSKYQKQAWEFLKYLGEKERQAKLYELEVKSGRLYGNPYPRKDMADLLLDNQYLGAIVRDGLILDSLPIIAFTYDNGLNDKLNNYLKDGINSILLNTSVKEATTVLGEGFTQILLDYKY